MTITEFLLARIAEEEEAAGLALAEVEILTENEAITTEWAWALFSRHASGGSGSTYVRSASPPDPARILAECAAKRTIVEDHAPTDTSHWDALQPPRPVPACRQCTTSSQEWRVTSEWDVADRIIAPCDTIRALAAIYADHRDYDPAWRVA